MVAGATGPLLGFAVLFVLPLIGAWLLPTDQFAMWAILSTISSISLSLDFGGVALVMARWNYERRGRLVLRGSLLSVAGSVLIGLIATVAWIPFSRTETGSTFSLGAGVAAIAVTTAGAGLRSCLLVFAQAALNCERFALRNFITAGQSLIAFAFTIAAIIATRSAWALPIGWLASGLIVLLVTVVWARRVRLFQIDPGALSRPDDASSTTAFVWSRTLATVIGALLLQSDRWVVGALAPPAFLAAYEIAWRLAAMPKFLVQNLSVAVGSRAATSRAEVGEAWQVLRRSLRIAAAVGLLAAIPFAVAYVPIARLVGVDDLPWMFAAMLAVYTFHAVTAPVTYVSVGLGWPTLDVPYLLLTAALALSAATLAFTNDQVWIFIIGNLVALAAGTAWFLSYGPKRIHHRLQVPKSVESRAKGGL
ncbi:oligosaccharide flippase family protein [Cellulomonas sp. Leaf334]|uniref:oligosaccharide flippase family protein n=1 Tax=Cellulomonas sp. Leaf334 TaxID=1736339 RepID=UPI0006F2C691|nr:oligosaccharide flippase family protein [Cellulomonas sp. Leaf334]KQR12069.1 hypothetical protein ASF78_12915 [Cellulomonas sp. Leaf334]